jgi:N6-L-threonylcarbamoyladenine synthase
MAGADEILPALRLENAVVLGIESSCDETAASVVDVHAGRLRVRSNVVASQHAVHERFTGVVPELASRAHLEHLLPVVRRALAEAGCDLRDVHAVAVGHRPGLIGSLLVGTAAAKALAWARGVPLIGVDHVAAHLVAGFLDRAPPRWPALGLVVSGGHTHLALVEDPCRIRVIGRTIDDAVGEAFDKAAVMLGLGYPGGPRLDAASEGGNDAAVAFPVPARILRGRRDHDGPARAGEPGPRAVPLDFSFSGLKTALLYEIRGVPEPPGRRRASAPPPALTPERVRDLAASFQRAAVAQIMDRTTAALAAHPVRTLLVGGGVVANRRLRRELEDLAARSDVEVFLPRMEHCVDNAAMIAGLAHFRLARGEQDSLALAPSPRSALSPREGERQPGLSPSFVPADARRSPR